MRKLIIAATTIAALAVPSVSMAAYTGNHEVDTNYSASYIDAYGPSGPNVLLTCNGVHEVTTNQAGATILVQDKMNCAFTSPTTGKRVRVFQPNQPLNWLASYGGWNSDFNGASATSMVGQANENGEAFKAVATYPDS